MEILAVLPLTKKNGGGGGVWVSPNGDIYREVGQQGWDFERQIS